MTLAELRRAVESKKRIQKAKERERAFYDYSLAILIAKGIARTNGGSPMPQLEEAYPHLFSEEDKQNREAELFKLRLKQFSVSNNKRLRGEN